jgi:3-oxoacyl-[acyl-carrier protein] reductase
VVNGRNAETHCRGNPSGAGAQVVTVAADITTPKGQEALLTVDILVNNNSGPPRRDFREIDRDALLAGVVGNMATPIELVRQVIDGMVERRFRRIVNITSASVKMPLEGLDLSRGARAGLTGFLAGVARSVAHANVSHAAVPIPYLDKLVQTVRYLVSRGAAGKRRESDAALQDGNERPASIDLHKA